MSVKRTLKLAGFLAIVLCLTSLSRGGAVKGQAAPTGPYSVYLPLLTKELGFADSFAGPARVLQEGKISEVYDPNWWVDSGAYLFYNGQTASTIQGELPASDPWRLKFFSTNPGETDNGYHPQNIFRLITRTTWKNAVEQVYFKINRYILSTDPHRQSSNGILLFNHYLDEYNLYYMGLRVDGTASIKKKMNGVYYVYAAPKILPGVYDRNTNPNLMPLNTWIGIRTVVTSNPDHSVSLAVYSDIGRTGVWTLMAQFLDASSANGGPPIDQPGYAGIRTDFMDVEFSDYSIVEK